MIDAISNFHFLRPEWLPLALLVVLLPFLGHRRDPRRSWAKVVAPELLQHLVVGSEGDDKKHTRWPLALLILLTAIALSGPTWQKVSKPVSQISDNLVVVLDLSLSMYATDLSPNRLTRAKQKLHDLLDQRDEGYTALVVYSGDAHTVTPLTDDVRTIESMISALDPSIMPTYGSEPARAIELATELLRQGATGDGRIVLITDGIEAFQIDEVRNALSGHALNILAVGTESGGPIDLPNQGYLKQDNEVVVAKVEFDQLTDLASDTGGAIAQVTLNETDLQTLPIKAQSLKQDQNAESVGFSDWKDNGYYLVLLLIPLALVLYRNGTFASYFMALLLGLTFLATSPETQAQDWANLWQTPDQRAMQAYQQGDYEAAAKLFNDPQWKAAAQYQAEQFEQAQNNLQSQSELNDLAPEKKSDLLYNQANALTKLGKYDEAIEKYNQALEQNADNEDAEFNRELVEQLLEQQQQEQQDQGDGDRQNEGEQGQNQGDQGQGDQSQGNQDQGNQGQNKAQNQGNQGPSNQNQTGDSQSQGSDSNPQQNRDGSKSDQSEQTQSAQRQDPANQDSEQQNAQGQSQADADKTKQSEQQQAAGSASPLSDQEKQAFDQWMRRVPDNPGGLLQEKFKHQYQQRRAEGKSNTPEGDRPLW